MGTPGFTGRILRVNLTTKQVSSLDTSKYESCGGGYGIATADALQSKTNWEHKITNYETDEVQLDCGRSSAS
jgi:aldehyde:ferredoxin oxidoreductase